MQPDPSPVSDFDINVRDAYAELRAGRRDISRMLIEQCREQAQGRADPVDQARVALIEGVDQAIGGNVRVALQTLLSAVVVVEGSEHRHDLISAYATVGVCMGVLGDPERGQQWVARAVALGELLQAPEALARARVNQGVLLNLQGEHQAAIDALLAAARQARTYGFGSLETNCWLNLTQFALDLAEACQARGDTAAAQAAITQALDFGRQSVELGAEHDRASTLGLALGNLAQAQVRARDYAAGQDSYEQALALVPDDPELRAEASLYLALAAREQGRLVDARQLLEQALAAARGTDVDNLMHAILLEYSELERAEGRLEQAFERYKARHELVVAHYQKRLRAAAHGAELLAGAEVARLTAEAAMRRESELRASHDELSREARRWEQAALRDPLTNTLNRRGFYQMAQHRFTQDLPLTLVLLDLDHFKQVNDLHGHAAGDAVLQQLAQCVAQVCRDVDALARFGGEEFVLLLPHAALDDALAHCERIRAAISAHDWSSIARGLRVSASLGLASRTAGCSVDALIAQADAALYAAKAAGRNCVRVASAEPVAA